MMRQFRALVAAARNFSTEVASASEKSAQKAPAGTGKSCGTRDTLGGRLVSLVHPKRSAVVAISKWKEEGRPVRKYELNRIVRELRKLKRYKHALEICEWMTLQKDIQLMPGDYAVHLDLIAKLRGLASAEKFFEDLPENMIDRHTCTSLLHTYVQHKMSAKAEALMEKMKECDFLKSPLPYNHMISLHISNGDVEKVPEMIRELRKNTKPDVITYNLMLAVCASKNDMETAGKIFSELKKAKLEPDWVTYSTLANLYIKEKEFDTASSTLKEMEKMASRRNRAAYSSLLSLYTNMNEKSEVQRIWKKMKALFQRMNDAEYTCIIASLVKLGELGEAEILYEEWESASTTGDARIPNILLAGYINRDKMEAAEAFYHRIVEKGIAPCYTTWELLTWGYLKKKQMEKVLAYFKQAIGSVKKWHPNDRLVKEVCKKLKEDGNTDGAENLLVILRKAGHLSTEVYNSLLRTYAKAGKMPLIVEERMKRDNIALDEETHKLIKATSQMCVSEVSSIEL